MKPILKEDIKNIRLQNSKKQISPSSRKKEIVVKKQDTQALSKGEFTHLHLHSQFSVLQATPELDGIFEKATALKMGAVAITDLGNLFGAF